jgi:hypothetical protein
MSRIALIGCALVLLVGSVVPTLSAPPTEQKQRAATLAEKNAVKAVVRPVARPKSSSRQSLPVAQTGVKIANQLPAKSPAVAQSTVKPTVTKAVGRPGTQLRLAGPSFDRSTRSNLLPAGSAALLTQKPQQVQRVARALPTPAPARSASSNSSAVKKIAGATLGAAAIGGGLVALNRPSAAATSTGAVRPAARLPLANLNHPHIKPVARVLPSIVGHKNANRPRLPLFVMAPALLGASWMGREFYVWNRRSYDNVGWVAPIPSCYVAGTVFYRNPWTGDCFNFESATSGDRFAVGTKVYTWTPAKYSSVEDMVDDQERGGTSIMSEPFRIANPTPPATKIALEGPVAPDARGGTQNLQGWSVEAMDCASCLTAIGPVEVTGGQCSVTISNNCGLPVTFDVEFQRNDSTFCQTKSDAAGAAEVIVCTQPCTTFIETRVKLKSAVPKLANSAPFKGCRAHWAALEELAR